MTNNRFEDVNNSTNKEAEMNNDLSNMTLKHYKDAELDFSKDGKKVKVIVSFAPEEEAFDWKQDFIKDFANNEKELAEKALTSEEEADIFAVIINEEYNEYCGVDVDFYKSVEEIKNDYKGIENIEIIIEDDDIYVDLINSHDIQIWRENVLNSRDESY